MYEVSAMPKVKRRAIPPKLRAEVYNKYRGHCAYCGKVLDSKGWQVDHLIPKQRESWGKATSEEVECFANLMPACRRCNLYKRAHSLETFRRYIREIPDKLQKTTFIYKVGLDYGIIEEQPWDGKFFFERWQEEQEYILD